MPALILRDEIGGFFKILDEPLPADFVIPEGGAVTKEGWVERCPKFFSWRSRKEVPESATFSLNSATATVMRPSVEIVFNKQRWRRFWGIEKKSYIVSVRSGDNVRDVRLLYNKIWKIIKSGNSWGRENRINKNDTFNNSRQALTRMFS